MVLVLATAGSGSGALAVNASEFIGLKEYEADLPTEKAHFLLFQWPKFDAFMGRNQPHQETTPMRSVTERRLSRLRPPSRPTQR